MTDALTEALKWLSRGVRPIPLRVGSKRAAVPWLGIQRTEPPIGLVKRWFKDGGNLGLLCGRDSGRLLVLDFDRPRAYFVWKGDNPGLVESYTVRTRRGWHVYFVADPYPDRSLRLLGCDVKINGYVVAPPSVHPSGYQYRAISDQAPILAVEPGDIKGLTETSAPSLLSPTGDGIQGNGLVADIKRELSLVAYLAGITHIEPSSPDGRWLIARCPFHNDRRPSMWVDSQRMICKCYKGDCSAGERPLDVINVYGMIRDIDNGRAIQELAARLGL